MNMISEKILNMGVWGTPKHCGAMQPSRSQTSPNLFCRLFLERAKQVLGNTTRFARANRFSEYLAITD